MVRAPRMHQRSTLLFRKRMVATSHAEDAAAIYSPTLLDKEKKRDIYDMCAGLSRTGHRASPEVRSPCSTKKAFFTGESVSTPRFFYKLFTSPRHQKTTEAKLDRDRGSESLGLLRTQASRVPASSHSFPSSLAVPCRV